METAVLVALEQAAEDFGRSYGTPHIYCVSCDLWLRDFQQYLWHCDWCDSHRRQSRVCIRRDREAINRWEEHRRLLRRELGLEQ